MSGQHILDVDIKTVSNSKGLRLENRIKKKKKKSLNMLFVKIELKLNSLFFQH